MDEYSMSPPHRFTSPIAKTNIHVPSSAKPSSSDSLVFAFTSPSCNAKIDSRWVGGFRLFNTGTFRASHQLSSPTISPSSAASSTTTMNCAFQEAFVRVSGISAHSLSVQRFTSLITFRLFNDEFLSDIKIKLVSNDKAHEYYAHKAVLCMESQDFMIRLQGEDQGEQWYLRRSMCSGRCTCTHGYSAHAIQRLANGNPEKEISIAIRVHTIADKYDVHSIYDPSIKLVQHLLPAA